ncbi:adenosylcobinamide-GDP ribazoletransferase [Caldanaerobacter subterraneus subsp. tengcongensis MB4]|uniref:Adenosylcobinamide-GDP ribazoletransferase n=1 Tax=Caldanaerobacter subterraneus subsp. tengcongensis (strain DSM 15242 / JCM 11007 / NBRC 100824 / MB4) TaxID=273068 RepID=COBS_CALS4|nr:adenosylcobinamide-GDP ribazoletransferase [Caldanaerobacter subterraneus]Q8RCN8.1 RecName: Full=Adenosylcobinamide-GDP ribazoletransferase; AltName: Full=Cobalamin synthase; AltName: Full=Cobalamin-5'-phosphate synthase [Caldanaerobacter subterraneus subsp. tengcongensis MB4]AAM23669.1 Cobalamin-5-phosphate synthase [Caldanaerobacter subterraneus subsp. tengcongensis MB4]MBE3578455.1 adenosylcobinamide-GDP ribazoletransferase [Caldanaerobacter subterraneus]MCS3916837.1 adenosylcobinamide-GD
MEELKALILSIQFMTGIPIPINIDVKEDKIYKIASYFPVVGLLIGGILYIAYLLLKDLFSREIVMTFLVAFSYILTRGMHIDGLADTFDGLFSNKDREKIIEIMKDSRLGTNGVLALVFMVILKILFLSDIRQSLLFSALLVSPVIARLSVVFSIAISKSARGGKGLGGLLLERAGLREFVIALLISTIAGYFVMPLKDLALLYVISLSFTCLISKYISKKIGGMTGDTLGAVNEFVELIAFIYFSIL